MELKVIRIAEVDLEEKFRKRVNQFILDEASNGEFINSLKFLSYHPHDRFVDDSIFIIDTSSGDIKSLVMAACNKDDLSTIISHPGTTFAGPIFNVSQGVDEIAEILEMILAYYEENYANIIFKLQPTIYSTQPIEDVSYLLMKSGYHYEYSALANVINLWGIKVEEDVFGLYKSRRRNQIRKLIKNTQYKFQENETIDERIWNNIHHNLEDRYASSPTHSYQEIMQLKKKFPARISSYVSYREDGEYGASGLVFKFKNVFHAQYLDQNYALAAENSNLLLNHQLIATAVAEGFPYFSFGASTENGGDEINQGLYDFKKTFGGGRVILPVFKKTG